MMLGLLFNEGLKKAGVWVWDSLIRKVFGDPQYIPYNLDFYTRELQVLGLCQKHPNN